MPVGFGIGRRGVFR